MAASFDDAIRAVLLSIPVGRVATCGTVARALGDMRAARAVAAWTLEHPDVNGADRVVRADLQTILRDVPRVRHPRPISTLPSLGLLSSMRTDQERLGRQVRERDDFGEVRSIGGVDVAYQGDRAYAAAVRCDAVSLEPVEIAKAVVHADFPYVPTYLAFREFPLAEQVLRRLSRPPDLLMVDGHGRLHPALFGFACSVGVRLNLPTIGVAKHPLCGKLNTAGKRSDGAIPVEHEGAIRGFAWSPRPGARPLYVSVGHRISLVTALEAVKRSTRNRHPEPLRISDQVSKEMKWEHTK